MWEKEKTQLRSLLFALSPWFPPGKEGGTAWEGFPIRNLFLQLKKRDLEALEVLRVMPGPCRDLPMAATSAAGIAANLHFEKPFISLPPLPPPATCPELFLLLQGLEKGGIVQIFLIFCFFKCKKKKKPTKSSLFRKWAVLDIVKFYVKVHLKDVWYLCPAPAGFSGCDFSGRTKSVLFPLSCLFLELTKNVFHFHILFLLHFFFFFFLSRGGIFSFPNNITLRPFWPFKTFW